MALPKAIENMEEEANKLHREAHPEAYAAEEKPKEEEAGNTDKAPETPKAEAPPPAEEEPTPEAPPEPPPAPEESTPVDWEAKYRTLQGKYNKEIGDLRMAVEGLQAEIADTRRQQAEGPKDKPFNAPRVEGGETEEAPDAGEALSRMEEAYGPEFIDDIRKIFRQEILNETKPLKEGYQAVQQTVAQTAGDRYLAQLTDLVPDWRTVMKTREFSDFMHEVDPFSGVRRLDLAKRWQSKHDAKAVARFYNAFKQANGGGTKPPASETPPSNKPNKEDLISPEGTRSAPQTGGGEIEPVRTSEMNAFAKDLSLGVFKGREAQAKAIQAKIDAAVMAGKVIRDT